MSGSVLHFGAGALGRGLVLPRITQAGGVVCVADTDTGLIDHIRSHEGYLLTIAGPEGRQQVEVPVAHAYAIGRDDADLDKAIAEAGHVTTSVQTGNLPRVVARLAAVWAEHSSRPRIVVGSENLRHVGLHLQALFHEQGYVDGVVCPDCVVDRISAALPEGYATQTEPYSEWVIESEGECDLPGPDCAQDVDRLFFRKRYLVNTPADGAAFLGTAKRLTHLHEAINDAEILERLSPLLALLRDHLARNFGFDRADLAAYQARSLQRLGNPGISRRLDTVARDAWRKFSPDERFLEPILAEARAGADIEGALDAFAAIVAAAEPDDRRRAERLESIWADGPASDLIARVAAGEAA